MRTGLALLFPLLLLFLSGCVGTDDTFAIHAPEGPMRWTVEDADGETRERFSEPWRYLDSMGNAVDGVHLYGSSMQFNRFFMPLGPGEGAMHTSVGTTHSYRWGVASAEDIGFLFTGSAFRTGDSGNISHGSSTLSWTVERANAKSAVVNWTLGDGHLISRFESNSPVAVDTRSFRGEEWHRARGAITPIEGSTHERGPLPTVRAPETAPLDFALPSGHPFSFQDAWLVWQQDERYALAQDWWRIHDQGELIWLDYYIVDENEGNATVYYWHARYYDDGDLLNVGVGWRVTHPSSDVKMQYPLYDQCPAGCIDTYAGRPRNASVEVPGTSPGWPEEAVTTASALGRWRDLGGERDLTKLTWRLVKDEPGLPDGVFLDEAQLVVVTDESTSIWDPTPHPPDRIGGSLQRFQTSIGIWSTQRLASGAFTGVQTEDRIF